ncbi:MAG: EscU/YscU/HrcU family type III secretion system export apparatus switch protein [Spirochaetota bacterium]
MPEPEGRKRDRALALRYVPGLPAPFLLAKGEGRQATRLLALAEAAGVPVIREEGLVEALFPLELGSCVPEEFYVIVAKVFAFVRSIEEA